MIKKRLEFEIILPTENEIDLLLSKAKTMSADLRPFKNSARRYYSLSGKIIDKIRGADILELMINSLKSGGSEEGCATLFRVKIACLELDQSMEIEKKLNGLGFRTSTDYQYSTYYVETVFSSRCEAKKAFPALEEFMPVVITAAKELSKTKIELSVPLLLECTKGEIEKIPRILSGHLAKITGSSTTVGISGDKITIVNFEGLTEKVINETEKAITKTLESFV